MRPRSTAAAFAAALLWSGAAAASPLPVVEVDCGSPARRCYALDPGARDLVTTLDAPHAVWTIEPMRPPDSANWRLVGVDVGFASSASFGFVFSTTGRYRSAALEDARFVDSTGRVLLSTAAVLDAFCFTAASGPYTGLWVCGDGNSIASHQGFGPAGRVPSDPVLPSLDGPITIDVRWAVFGEDEPIASMLTIRGLEFLSVYERAEVPEPGTLHLCIAAFLGLAAVHRWRRAGGPRPTERARTQRTS